MSEIKFSKAHAWAKFEEDGTAVIGISDFAQNQLGDLVYVELPDIGSNVTADENAGVVESNKTADDVIAPVSGKVIAVNTGLDEDPEKVNEEPTGEGWIFKVELTNPSELDALLNKEAYQAFLEE